MGAARELVVDQEPVVIPDFTVKDLLSVIPYAFFLLSLLPYQAQFFFPPQSPLSQTLCFQVVIVYVSTEFIYLTVSVLTAPSVMDVAVIAAIYNIATLADSLVNPESISLPHPLLYPVARFSVWALYTFWTGLFATGLWVVAHECGHQAFSESKLVNNTVGWILHSA